MFPATNGQATGIGGLVLAAALALYALAGVDSRVGLPLLALAFLLAVLTYAAVLRPRVGLSGDELILRQMFGTTRIPLAAIQEVKVGQITIIRVADRKYDTPALSRPRPSLSRRLRGTEPDPTATDHLVIQIDKAMTSARTRAGVVQWSEEQAALATGIRTEWTWSLVIMAALGAVALALALVL